MHQCEKFDLQHSSYCSLVSWVFLSSFYSTDSKIAKVKSVQEACAKCFAVHLLKFEILQTTWKNKTKKHQNARFIDEKLKTKSLIFFVSFFSCDLQDFKVDMKAAKHLA